MFGLQRSIDVRATQRVVGRSSMREQLQRGADPIVNASRLGLQRNTRKQLEVRASAMETLPLFLFISELNFEFDEVCRFQVRLMSH